MNDHKFCEIFIYPYHQENNNIIPEVFLELNPNVTESIFVRQKEILNKEEKSKEMNAFKSLETFVDLLLFKNDPFPDKDIPWSHEKQKALNYIMTALGYEFELEKLILDKLKKAKSDDQLITKIKFINQFISEFHNKKITQYTPDFIHARNKKMVISYHSITEVVNRIQAWLDNELVRKRIEFNTLNNNNDNSPGLSCINRKVIPFCYIELGCDVYGRYNFSYGIDSKILNMLDANMASTLLRRIYEFTSGELEPFVVFTSLHMDCISYFENSLQKEHINNYQLIEVKRNEEKFMAEMLNK